MPQAKITPPPGYTLDSAPPEPPPGYTLDGSQAAPVPPQHTPGENAFQQYIDALTKIEPFNTRPGVGGHIVTALGNAGGGVLSPLGLLAHPVQSGKSFMNTMAEGFHTPDPFPDTPSIPAALVMSAIQEPAGTAENLVGGLLGGEAMSALRDAPVLRNLSEGMKAGGGRMIDRTVGVLKADKARGAQPGRAYLEGGGGPTMSMRGLAEKASDIKSDAGARIGSAIDDATTAGVRIPADLVAKTIGEPINRAHAIMSGPGGGGAGPVEDLSATFRPSLMDAVSSGGFTPRDLFDLKRNVAQNTSWGDPTQVGLKSLRQQITGGLGDTLSDAVPELRPLNKVYQGVGNLAKRANLRAETGQSPLTQIGRRAAEGAAGAALGMTTGHPLLSVLPLIADSVPVRTSIASGLFNAGRALPALPGALPIIAPLASSAGRRRPKPRPDDDSGAE